ncbi:MAG: hypothetical protein MK237_02185 [Gemmatimonadetes bacterium]|nr:hypothetical protein [Gemmatimonadota bacterium]
MRRILLVALLLVLGCRPRPPEPRDMNTLDMEGRTWIDPLTGEAFTGPYESYYENGDVYERGTFKDGRFEGPFETFYDNGQLYRKGAFKIWTQAELEVEEQRPRTRLDGPYESYFEDGRLWTKGIFEDGAECGAWFEDGENVTHPACVRS